MFMKYLSPWGDSDKHSYGLAMLTSRERILSGAKAGEFLIDNVGNGKSIILRSTDKKWFLDHSMKDQSMTILLGAVCGDVAGSVYEHCNIDHFPDKEQMIHPRARVTDDSVLTMAVAKGMKRALDQLGENWMQNPEYREVISNSVAAALRELARRYPFAGYGGSFVRWLHALEPKPYNSWGNGAAMRVSFAGWAGRTLEEAEILGELSAAVTHDHPEGIKAARVVAGIIYLLRSGKTKEDVRAYAGAYYDLNFTIDQIRPNYRFDVSCQGSVPQAIVAFLEGEDFADVLARAIWLGGDSDTIAAIAGSMAEVIYSVPQKLLDRVTDLLDNDQRQMLEDVIDWTVKWNHMVE